MNSRLTTIAVLLVALLPMSPAAQDAFSTLTGSIVDQSGGALPGVAVVATNTTRGSRHEVFTDGRGRFELIGLAPGSYTLDAGLPGFETFQQTLTLSGQTVDRDLTLQIGSLQETVSVSSTPSSQPQSAAEPVVPRPPNCDAAPGRAGLKIGGQIRTPRKIHHVAPIYPPGSPGGVVTLNAVIGIDGLVKETTITNTALDPLARAAVDAIQQWEFDPTLLNCEAVEVRMSVVVDFH
jgi:hypothetical protein